MNAHEWNECLIDAVFSARTGTGPVRTIKATDKFLALASNSQTHSPQAVKAAHDDFVRAYGGGPRKVRQLFEYEQQMAIWKGAPGPPTFFGQLYLSLLIASATEDTHGDGDFRRRLCLMLNLPVGDYVSSGLPLLWEELATWSTGRSHAASPVRKLILPDPGHETIIGYSKRLAFPGYRDAAQLSYILFQNAVSHESPLNSILNVIGEHLGSFSVNFQSEYGHLLRALKLTPNVAPLLPLWAAIEAVSFEPIGKSANARTRFALELAFDEFGHPEAYLFTDKQPSKALESKCRSKQVENGPSECSLQIEPHPPERVLQSLLSSRGVLRLLVKASPVDRQAAQGCMIFAPSDEIPWLWRPSLPAAGPAQCLCSEVPRQVLTRFYDARGQPRPRFEAVGAVPGWYLSEIEDCSLIARRSSALDGLDQYDALLAGIAVPKIVLRGAVRLPQGILLNSASRPEVIAIGCDSVRVVATYETDSSVSLGNVDPTPFASCFRPSVDQISRLQLPAIITFVGARGADDISLRTFADVSVPDVPLKLEFDSNSYLEESPFGQLTSIRDNAGSGMEFQENPSNSLAAQLLTNVDTQIPSSSRREAETGKPFGGVWDDACEALYGAFLNARSLPDRRIVELANTVFYPYQRPPPAMITTVLWHGRKIMKRWHRRWRGARYFPVLPYLQFDEQTEELRMIGLTSRLMRQRFRAITATTDVISAPSDFGPPSVPLLSDVDLIAANQIANEMQLSLTVERAPTLVGAREIAANISVRYRKNLTPTRVRFWSSQNRFFVDSIVTQDSLRLRLSDFERAPSIYEILDGDKMVWATESRAWAILMYQVFAATPATSLDGENIVSDQPLPFVFALAATISGGGLGLSFLDRTTTWTYRFGNRRSLSSFLGAWTERSFGQSPGSLARWAASIGRGTKQNAGTNDQATFARRYSAPPLRKTLTVGNE